MTTTYVAAAEITTGDHIMIGVHWTYADKVTTNGDRVEITGRNGAVIRPKATAPIARTAR